MPEPSMRKGGRVPLLEALPCGETGSCPSAAVLMQGDGPHTGAGPPRCTCSPCLPLSVLTLKFVLTWKELEEETAELRVYQIMV